MGTVIVEIVSPTWPNPDNGDSSYLCNAQLKRPASPFSETTLFYLIKGLGKNSLLPFIEVIPRVKYHHTKCNPK